ncbi:protease [Pseudonocardiaceae bacterium YIM PH 21723]|nr:protease [Pseudonocardiaceae bacterium YIM PH 21723]
MRARVPFLAVISVLATGLAGVSVPASAQPLGLGEVTGLIVNYRPGTAEATSDVAAQSDAQAKRATLGRRLATGSTLITVTNPLELTRVAAAFAADPKVASVEPDALMYPLAESPNDPEYPRQWHYSEDKAGMRVPGAWDQSTGKGAVVAVIDTGYVKHPDLEGNIIAGYDFISSAARARDGDGRDADASDEGDWNNAIECLLAPARGSSWHGTHVAGTIAALTNNGTGVAGIAYNAKVQPVRVLGRCGGTTSDIIDAIAWASGGSVPGVPANATKANVINMSLGGSGACSSALQSAITGAVGRGTSVVVAAGNSNADVSGFNPANCDNVIAVASTNRNGDRSFYSNFGEKVDIAAPGGQTRNADDAAGTVTTPENGVWSTLNDGATTPGNPIYKPYMGTSMAAPHIAGLVALLLGKNAGLSPAQVESLIKANARPIPGKCDEGCGAGLADATATVAAS